MNCLTPRSKRPCRDIAPKRRVKRALENDETLDSRKLENRTALLKSPLRNITNFSADNDSVASTPKKLKIEYSNPDTPTCNMKLLTNIAATLEYAKDNEKGLPLHNTVMKQFHPDSSLLKSRKDKSISIICEKFISEFPECPQKDENIPISLTQAAKHLGVEKRRLYDVVNILESVEMVKKSGKNEYTWCGKTDMLYTLQSLKNLALLNGLDRVVKSALLAESKSKLGQPLLCQNVLPPPHFFAAFKKEKSLGTLARQFLSLFLTEDEPLVISLTIAAQILLGKTEGITQNKKKTEFKTKVRRLYDVANVLAPLQVLQRESKKQGYGSPSFKYCGPSLRRTNILSDPEVKFSTELEKQNYLRNFYLLPTKKNGFVETSFLRTRSENWHSRHAPWAKKPQLFPRHSSLQDMCNVAEIERTRLYSSASSQSFNENSNDSSLSFLSSYSTDTSVTESQCEVFKPIEKTIEPLAIPQGFTQSVYNLAVPKNVSGNKCVCDAGIEKGFNETTLKESEVSASEFSGNHRVIELSPEQQTTILKFLNMKVENGKVALLFIPNVKNSYSNGLNSSSVNKQNSCSMEEDTNRKRKVSLPISLFLDLKNRQMKSNFPPGSATNTCLSSANSLANSPVKVNGLYDCTNNKITVYGKNNADVDVLKIIAATEPASLKKSAILISNSHTENATEKNLSNSATCDLMQVLIPVSLNDNQQYELLNESPIESQKYVPSNGNTNLAVNSTGNKLTTRNFNGLSAIKEKIISSPITVHLKKLPSQNTLPQEETLKKANSPEDLKASVNTLPIVVIKKPVYKLPYNVIAKKL